jgi:hypothetical protein
MYPTHNCWKRWFVKQILATKEAPACWKKLPKKYVG